MNHLPGNATMTQFADQRTINYQKKKKLQNKLLHHNWNEADIGIRNCVPSGLYVQGVAARESADSLRCSIL